MKKYKKYTVELSVYHGTTFSNSEKIKNIGAAELFFTTNIARAKDYSSDGTIIKTTKTLKFEYLNEAKTFVREWQKFTFLDFILKIEKWNSKKFKVERFKKSMYPTQGRSETAWIFGDKTPLFSGKKLNPSNWKVQHQYKHSKLYNHQRAMKRFEV